MDCIVFTEDYTYNIMQKYIRVRKYIGEWTVIITLNWQ